MFSYTFSVGCIQARVSLGQPGFHPGASVLGSQGCASTNHAYTEDQSKEPVFEVATVEHGHGALMHVGSWACKTLCIPRDLLCMFLQTSGGCGMSGASVPSPVLPSLCSGVCFKFDSSGTMGFMWFRNSSGLFSLVLNCLIREFRNYSFGHSSSETLLFQVFNALIQ